MHIKTSSPAIPFTAKKFPSQIFTICPWKCLKSLWGQSLSTIQVRFYIKTCKWINSIITHSNHLKRVGGEDLPRAQKWRRGKLESSQQRFSIREQTAAVITFIFATRLKSSGTGSCWEIFSKWLGVGYICNITRNITGPYYIIHAQMAMLIISHYSIVVAFVRRYGGHTPFQGFRFRQSSSPAWL